jgi:outer membrane lipoprotein-sorting protein
MLLHTRIHRRWAVPAIALLGVLGVGAVPQLFQTASASTPDLPTLTPAELLAKARTAQVTSLSGTVTLTSKLGLPSLGSLGGRSLSSFTDLLAGQHSAKVWVDGPDHVRIATAAPMAETNWIRNGTDLWSYDSATLRVTHTTLAADTTTTPETDAAPDPAHETPVDFANELLAQVTPSTDVSVESPQYVAGRPVYELSLAPHGSDSTVQQIAIAVDAATGLPLEVKIVARSTGATAFAFGFSKISFDQPAASTFAFTPPPGSTTREAPDITTFINPPGGRNRSSDSAPPAAPTDPSAPTKPESSADAADKVATAGSDWGTVVMLPAGTVPKELMSLMSSSPQVTAGALTGRMLSTPLLSVLLLDDGRAAVAALTPAALTDAVAKLG